mmetsp:Transcript_24085/g.53560  ORF Transcript_24085/g.53560 Transcript_24085/m.53560 type:complete len:412 (+) Transcript_24085:1762-2997(+)
MCERVRVCVERHHIGQLLQLPLAKVHLLRQVYSLQLRDCGVLGIYLLRVELSIQGRHRLGNARVRSAVPGQALHEVYLGLGLVGQHLLHRTLEGSDALLEVVREHGLHLGVVALLLHQVDRLVELLLRHHALAQRLLEAVLLPLQIRQPHALGPVHHLLHLLRPSHLVPATLLALHRLPLLLGVLLLHRPALLLLLLALALLSLGLKALLEFALALLLGSLALRPPLLLLLLVQVAHPLHLLQGDVPLSACLDVPDGADGGLSSSGLCSLDLGLLQLLAQLGLLRLRGNTVLLALQLVLLRGLALQLQHVFVLLLLQPSLLHLPLGRVVDLAQLGGALLRQSCLQRLLLGLALCQHGALQLLSLVLVRAADTLHALLGSVSLSLGTLGSSRGRIVLLGDEPALRLQSIPLL